MRARARVGGCSRRCSGGVFGLSVPDVSFVGVLSSKHAQECVGPLMYRPSEGMRRLGIAVGVVAVMSWIVFMMVGTKADFSPREWTVFLVAMVVIGVPSFFLLGVLVSRGIEWIVAGFRQDKKR